MVHQKWVICEICKGCGHIPSMNPYPKKECFHCKGTGKVQVLKYEITEKQPCVYANSRYTTATNSPKRHIDNGRGKPLCQTSATASISFTPSIDKPDCKKCINKMDLCNEEVYSTRWRN